MKTFCIARDFVLNSAAATIGVKVMQDVIGSGFHPRTLAGVYQKAIILGSVLGFVLGYAVYWRWRSKSAFWVCAVGVCTFAARVALGQPDPGDLAEIASSATLAFLSVQCVLYSFGAVCCSWWNSATKKAVEATPTNIPAE